MHDHVAAHISIRNHLLPYFYLNIVHIIELVFVFIGKFNSVQKVLEMSSVIYSL